jgi:hypothetical protein
MALLFISDSSRLISSLRQENSIRKTMMVSLFQTLDSAKATLTSSLSRIQKVSFFDDFKAKFNSKLDRHSSVLYCTVLHTALYCTVLHIVLLQTLTYCAPHPFWYQSKKMINTFFQTHVKGIDSCGLVLDLYESCSIS